MQAPQEQATAPDLKTSTDLNYLHAVASQQLPSAQGQQQAAPAAQGSPFDGMSREQVMAIANQGQQAPSEAQGSPPATGIGGALGSLSTAPMTNPVSAIAQNINQGAAQAEVGAVLSLRAVTDSLGITSPDKSNAVRGQLAAGEQAANASADANNVHYVGKAAQFAGQMGAWAPAIYAAGPSVMGAGASVAGPGLAGRMVGSGLMNAVMGGLTDSNNGVRGQLENAGLAGVTGAVLQPSFEMVGGILTYATKKIGGASASAAVPKPTIDPKMEEAFRQMKMEDTVRPSQVESNPVVRSTYKNLEQQLATNPVAGTAMKGSFATQLKEYEQLAPKIVNELDTGLPKSSDLYKQAVDAPELQNKTAIAKDTQEAAQAGLSQLKKHLTFNEDGKLISTGGIQQGTLSTLQMLSKGAPMNMAQLQSARQDIGTIMVGLRGETGYAAAQERSVAINMYKALSDDADKVASANGVGDIWKTANLAHKGEQIIDGVKDAFQKAGPRNADLSQGAEPQMTKFITLLNKNIQHLQDEGYSKGLDTVEALAPALQKIDAMQRVGNKLYSYTNLQATRTAAGENIKGVMAPVAAAGSTGAILGAGAGAAAGSMIGGPVGTIVGGTVGSQITKMVPYIQTALWKGLGGMATTPTGLAAIAKIGKIPNPTMQMPAVRLVLTTALGLGIADAHKNPHMATSSVSSYAAPSFDRMTRAQIEAIASQGQQPTQPQQPDQSQQPAPDEAAPQPIPHQLQAFKNGAQPANLGP